jgi:predicted GH43/DUF377 family glycosyl hydrolase
MAFVMFNGTFFNMWYGANPTGSGSEKIGFAHSNDGTSWTRYPVPVLVPSSGNAWDSGNVFEPSVVWNGTLYLMYYTATGLSATSTGTSVGLATSKDMIHWQKYAGNPILTPGPGLYDKYWVKAEGVIYDPPTYKMWYSALDQIDRAPTNRTIAYADSTDGVHWTKYARNPVLTAQSGQYPWVQHPSVIKLNGVYLMAMTYLEHAISYATSFDGLNWTAKSEQLVNYTFGGAGMENDADFPSLVFAHGSLMLWYRLANSSAGPGALPVAIGLATCPNFIIPSAVLTTTVSRTETLQLTSTSVSTQTSTIVSTQTVISVATHTEIKTTSLNYTEISTSTMTTRVPNETNGYLEALAVALSFALVAATTLLIRWRPR